MKKRNVIFTVVMILLSLSGFAQSKILEGVVDFEVRSLVQIVNNKQIVGYGIFYTKDKMKKSALFGLTIFDENLKQIGSTEFEGPKNLILRKAAYESDRILLNFYDEDKKDGYKYFVKVFDLKGKEMGLVPYEPEKVKSGMFGSAIAAEMEKQYEGTTNVEGKGFISIHPSKAKTGGEDIQMIGLDGKLKWEQNITAEKGDRTDLYLLATTTNTIILMGVDRSGLMARDGEPYMLGLSNTDGKQLFKKSMKIKGFAYDPMFLKKTTDGKIKIISSMSDAGDKYLNAKPNGISIGELNDLTGEIKTIKDFNFLNDLGSVLNMKNENKSEDGYIKTHDLLLMPDGSMVLVGEFFRKTVSALGVAGRMLGGNTSAAQATIEDMFLLRIDKNLKPISLEKIEKDKQRVLLPTEGMPIGLMARYLSSYGEFGYMYTDEGMDGKQKTILASGAFGEDTYGTVAINVDDKKGYTTKKFKLTKEKKVSYHIARAKPGYVMVTKYNSKEKTITLNFEKVN
jgi:hypothetical protein